MRDLILNFHGVGAQERTLEPGEQDVWMSEAGFLSVLDEVAEDSAGVRLTFDDGNASDLDIALPRLLERGLVAEYFVLSGKLGQRGYLSRSAVRELDAAGMQIGSHGAEHLDWRGLDAARLRAEVQDSRALLEDLLQAPVPHVACPFGSYDRRVLAFLRRAGVARVYTSDRGAARSAAWLQPRNTLTQDAGTGTLAAMRRAARDPLERGVRALKALVKRIR